jgi:hypothetical protein
MSKKLIQVVYSVNDQALLKAEKTIHANEIAAKKASDQVTKYGKDAAKAGDSATSSFFNLRNVIAAVGIVQLGKQIIDVTAQFQKFSAVLTNTLGSKSEAQKALKNIKDFAATTPFSVQEVTASFVKLANQGFKPTIAQLKLLGDVASSQGKSFDMLSEAIIDAQTGEFERLKEFGIRASKEGDKVSFTFKGVKAQVDFTSEAIREYVLSLGDAVGVAGSMEAISSTLEGRISNLGDAFDNLLLTIGNLTSGPMFSVIESMGRIVTATANIKKELALVGQAISPFHDLRDVAKEVLDYQLQIGRTDSGKRLVDLLKPFTSQDPNEFLRAYDENHKKFIETLTKEGESIDDINVFWSRYVDLQILAANESREAEAAQRLLNVLKAKEGAAVAVAKAKADTEEIRSGGEALYQKRKAQETEEKEQRESQQRRLDSLQTYGEKINTEVKGQIATELSLKKQKSEEEIKYEEEAARRKMELQYMAFDYGVALLGQFLMAKVNSEDETFMREKGNFDKRLKLAGDNEQARQQIETEREAFETAQDAKAQAFADRQAKLDKERQIKQMIVQGLLNSIRALGNPPVPNFAAAGITGLYTLGQVATAKGIGLKDGQVNIQGAGTTTSDSIPARLSRGESVINAEATARSLNLLEAINERRIDDSFLKKPSGQSPVVFDTSRIEEKLDKMIELVPDYYEEGHFVNKVITKKKTLRQHSRGKYFSSGD